MSQVRANIHLRERGADEHPGICKFYDWAEDGRSIYLVSQFVQGADLFDAIARRYSKRDAKGMKHKWTELEARKVKITPAGKHNYQ